MKEGISGGKISRRVKKSESTRSSILATDEKGSEKEQRRPGIRSVKSGGRRAHTKEPPDGGFQTERKFFPERGVSFYLIPRWGEKTFRVGVESGGGDPNGGTIPEDKTY